METTRLGAVVALVALLISVGCSGMFGEKPQPVETVPEVIECPDTSGLEARITELDIEVSSLERQIGDLQSANHELESQKREDDEVLVVAENRIASLEEQLATLEIELQSAVDEAVRSKSRIRSVNSQALAISRIAEVRVELESALSEHGEEVASRLQRAQEFLSQADAVLAEENFAGAAFLAERAEDLIHQARTVKEITAASGRPIIPIIPPRSMLVLKNSNLRDGPGIEFDRVGRVGAESTVTAVARCKDWFQVEVDEGLRAWIAGHLVR